MLVTGSTSPLNSISGNAAIVSTALGTGIAVGTGTGVDVGSGVGVAVVCTGELEEPLLCGTGVDVGSGVDVAVGVGSGTVMERNIVCA